MHGSRYNRIIRCGPVVSASSMSQRRSEESDQVEADERVGRPAAAVEEGDQRLEEGDVLNALGLDHCALQNR